VGIATFVAFAILDGWVVRAANIGLGSFNPIDILVLCTLLLTVGLFAGLGFTDDWSKATGRGGLRARAKFAVQVVLSISFIAACLWFRAAVPMYDTMLVRFMPFSASQAFGITELLMCLTLLVVLVGTCNAANLTDGIDGLAAGLTVIAGWALLLYGPNTSYAHFGIGLWNVALAGACLGFLWFNKHPARVFMGDTGSLAIGAALAISAILLRAVFLLPFIGFIFYIEMFSVMIQVGYFKWTKRRTGEGQRIFRRAPLHHHFELGGWSEWRVVAMFWAVNLITTSIGLVLWHKGVLPRWP
jgi:phospho-N-acetylmuramoyl-pentapeptide-transferase